MRPISNRKRVPTREDAHQWAKGAVLWGMREEDHLTDAERVAEIEKVRAELLAIIQQHFPRTRVLEYAILKSHLIVERAVTHIIRCSAPVLVPPEDIGFTFMQKLKIATLLGYGMADPTLIPSIEILNQVRNQVAHRFQYDRALVDELLRLNSDDYTSFSVKTDTDRIRGLRWFCSHVAGTASGSLQAKIHLTARSLPGAP